MYDRNKAVRDITKDITSRYYFNPVDGTISRNSLRASTGALCNFNIVGGWYPFFDENNQYIGFNSENLGFVGRDEAVARFSIDKKRCT
jgi:hypothetical protein